MTDQLFTPLQSHPSTWRLQCEQLQAEKQELAMQVLASEGQAEEAYKAQQQAESAASWADIKANQAVNEAKALRARVATLEAALREIGHSDDHFGNWKGACQHRQRLARNALRSAALEAKP